MTDSADLETRLRSLSIDRSGAAPIAEQPSRDAAPQSQPLSRPGGRRRSRRIWPYILFGPVLCTAVALTVLPDLRAQVAGQVMPHAAPILAQAEQIRDRVFAEPEDRAAATVVPAPAPSAAPVEVAAPVVQAAPILPTIVGSGYVIAPRAVVVKSEIGGRVARIEVQVGDQLRAGDALLILDRSEAELDRARAQAQLELARSQVKSTQAEHAAAVTVFERQETLFKRGAGRGVDLDNARLALVRLSHAIEIAKAEVDSAALTLRHAEMRLEKHVLRAPFDAVVVDLPAAPGMLISSGEVGGSDRAGLLTLMDMSQLYVDVDVSERNIASVEIEQTAAIRLDAFPDRALDAHVVSIDPRASRDKATVTVRLQLDGTDLQGVRPDMSAKATFINPSDRALALLRTNRSY